MLDFQRSIRELERLAIKVVCASTDTEVEAQKTVEKYRLVFPVCFGLDPREVSEKTGAFYNPERDFINATGFILNREARVMNAVYSTNNQGRLVAKNTLAFIEAHMKDEK